MGNCGKTCGNCNFEEFNRKPNNIDNSGKLIKDKSLKFNEEINQGNLNNVEKKRRKCNNKSCNKNSILRRKK